MKLGAEDKKKVGILAGLGLVAIYLLWTNVLSTPGVPGAGERAAAPPAAVSPSAPALPTAAPAGGAPRRATPGQRTKGVEEFRPTLRAKRPEERVDPASIDPTLRFDLLAKVQKVDLAGGARNVFQFGTAPPPKPAALTGPEPKVLPGKLQWVKTAEEAKAAEPPKPPKPPPPPINLKYYGFSTTRQNGRKTAFFLDGEDILVAGEGETVKKRYKVVRINVTSVVMEDTEAKSQQSLPIQEELAGA